jgi:hypothetical protein
MSLPIHGRAVREIAETLAQLDHRGETVTPGVTPIDADRPSRSRRVSGVRARPVRTARS